MKNVLLTICLGVALVVMTSFAEATPIVAYEVPFETAGNQTYSQALGMNFDVHSDINIFSLGAFDDNSDGFNREIKVRLYDRSNTASFLVEKIFTTGNTGSLIGGSRFLDLDSPLFLSAGFEGAIVAYGYGIGERNGNKGSVSGSWTTNDGGGLLSFVDGGFFGGTAYPTRTDSGPADRYAAGTFIYDAVTPTPVPEPATVFLLSSGLAGLVWYKRRHRNS
ncbi:MAG: PEP-CTERM sorting domain-containing protein [Geoalkalibacter sp.]|uniref:PEP-CTERM sorting domain-containing protein n=1 Tax=Geoalkalibacter sp. TaxID=3041440 RepID=UPI003D0A9DB8